MSLAGALLAAIVLAGPSLARLRSRMRRGAGSIAPATKAPRPSR